MKTTREKEFDDLWAKALAEEDRIEAKANKSKLGHEKAIWAVDRRAGDKVRAAKALDFKSCFNS